MIDLRCHETNIRTACARRSDTLLLCRNKLDLMLSQMANGGENPTSASSLNSLMVLKAVHYRMVGHLRLWWTSFLPSCRVLLPARWHFLRPSLGASLSG